MSNPYNHEALIIYLKCQIIDNILNKDNANNITKDLICIFSTFFD